MCNKSQNFNYVVKNSKTQLSILGKKINIENSNSLNTKILQLFLKAIKKSTTQYISECVCLFQETEANIVAQVQQLTKYYKSALTRKKCDEFVRQFKFSTRPFQSLPGAKIVQTQE
eukprot:TRINITY_DN14963_c0_g1_i2.p3 TRINITY_DN14963_c0_g1~~TRINITY_DN14963_c0_g1_i2.p3  ORF type:complete len:116 (+),score=8.41 TRINITY_DN14963_c0_g1_i2:350-697(+)